MKQRTEEWFNAREGRFTSSRISELLGIKGLGKTGLTYIQEKAIEKAFGRDREEQFVTFDMQRGINLEPVAFEIFAEQMGLEFIEVKEAEFFPYGLDSGSSPDGLVGKDAVLEIKCPKPNKFFNLVLHGESVIDKGYIAQMQHQMLCTNSKRCHFFNYIVYNNEPMHHEIIIERDEVMIEFMKERIEQAVIERDKYVKELLKK
jgi:exodeoxyribonuclease (lambda-induced)